MELHQITPFVQLNSRLLCGLPWTPLRVSVVENSTIFSTLSLVTKLATLCFIYSIFKMSQLFIAEFCDPLGNVNIFVPLIAANKSDGALRNRSLIFVSARMDSASMVCFK